MDKQHSFNLISSQDDPSDAQLSQLMLQVRQAVHRRVERVNSQLATTLSDAITAKRNRRTSSGNDR